MMEIRRLRAGRQSARRSRRSSRIGKKKIKKHRRNYDVIECEGRNGDME